MILYVLRIFVHFQLNILHVNYFDGIFSRIMTHVSEIMKIILESRRRRRRMMIQRRREMLNRRRKIFLAIMCILYGTTIERSFWVKTRSGEFWDYIVLHTFTDDDWKENFRMTKSTFMFICSKLRRSLTRANTNYRKSITVEKRLAITLWRLSTNCDFRSIGHLFGVAHCTASGITIETCQAIVDTFADTVISFPRGDELHKVIVGFDHLHRFPQCAGAIDGTHIPILAPKEYPTDYYNRKSCHSIILQAVCDHNYRFTDIMVGWPGRVHDARVFSNSSIYNRGQRGILFPNAPRTLHGVDVPIMILGDPAYPLLPWLMKGFSDNGRLSNEQTRFNTRLSSARMVIEGAFGRLKGRWRSLLKRNDSDLNNIPTMVTACCILHNICESRRDEVDDDWLEEAREEDVFQPVERPLGQNHPINRNSAPEIRNALMQHML